MLANAKITKINDTDIDEQNESSHALILLFNWNNSKELKD